MHADHQLFLDALSAKRTLRVKYFSKKEGKEFERVCAPLDYGPLRGAEDTLPRYQFWNLEGKRKPLNIPVLAEDLRGMTLLPETFDPESIITWAFKPGAWHVTRDWGEFS